MEFSPEPAGDAEEGQGRPRTLAIGRATTGASMPMRERWRRPDATSAIACSLSPTRGSDADGGDDAADGDPAPGGLALLLVLVGQAATGGWRRRAAPG